MNPYLKPLLAGLLLLSAHCDDKENSAGKAPATGASASASAAAASASASSDATSPSASAEPSEPGGSTDGGEGPPKLGLEKVTAKDASNPLNGRRIKSPSGPEVYLIDNGYRRLIPDPETYLALFRNSDNILVDPGVAKVKEGPPLDHGAVLGRGDGRSEVYLIDKNGKQYVPTVAVFDKYWFNDKRIVVMPLVAIDAIPTRADLH